MMAWHLCALSDRTLAVPEKTNSALQPEVVREGPEPTPLPRSF